MTVRLISKGRPLSPADIATLEGRLQVSLPADYQEFLLANNAAVPEQNIYKKGKLITSVAQFFGMSNDEWRDLVTANTIYGERLPAGFLAIGGAAGGNLICLELESGSIYFWDHEQEAMDNEAPSTDNMECLASSLREFLKSLKPYSAGEKPNASRVMSVSKKPNFDEKFKDYL
jgi:hypothetical protein